jgi:hypothetical protein
VWIVLPLEPRPTQLRNGSGGKAALTEPEELHEAERYEQKKSGHKNRRKPNQINTNRAQKLQRPNSPNYMIPQKSLPETIPNSGKLRSKPTTKMGKNKNHSKYQRIHTKIFRFGTSLKKHKKSKP